MHKIKIPSKTSLDLAYLCGVLAGDGSINVREEKHDYEIKCVGNPENEQNFYYNIICPLFKDLFGLPLQPSYFDNNTTFGIRLWSKQLVQYLVEEIGLPQGKKYDKLKIPPLFYKNKELTRSFIAGVIDTDFCLSVGKRNYPRLRGVSKSESFINEIRQFLISDGFFVAKHKRAYYDPRVKKVVTTYEICLSGREQFELWLEKIGTRHIRYFEKIKKVEGLKAPPYSEGRI